MKCYDAWKIYYDLNDGRVITAGAWGSHIRFGYIRQVEALNR